MAMELLQQGQPMRMRVTDLNFDQKWLKLSVQTNLQAVEEIENLMTKLEPSLEREQHFIHQCQLPVGHLYAVRTIETGGKWCRARVVGWASHDTFVVVYLIDYGQTLVVTVRDVRQVDRSVFLMPEQSRECILADVMSPGGDRGKWSSEAVEFCNQSVLHHDVIGQVVSAINGSPVVRIFKSGDVRSFSNMLLDNRLAASLSAPDATPVPAFQPKPLVGRYRETLLEVGKEHPVYVSHVLSPQKFYVQCSETEDQLAKTMEEIDEHFSSNELEPLPVPLPPNIPCVARFSEDGNFYRSLVTRSLGNQTEVLFVDYGNSELKDLAELGQLPVQFVTLPMQAVECFVAPDVGTRTEEFMDATRDRLLSCVVLSREGLRHCVVLKDNGRPMFGQSSRESSSLETLPQCKQLELDPRSSHEFLITSVTSIDEFYGQLLSNSDEIEQMMACISSQYSALEPHIGRLKPNEYVPDHLICALFTEDKQWYRAQIVSQPSNTTVVVWFIDYGNFTELPAEWIKRLTPDLRRLPAQAVKLSLNGMESIPPDLRVSTDIQSYFETLILDKTLVAQIKSVTHGSYSVDLFDKTQIPVIFVNEEIRAKAKSQNAYTIPVVSLKSQEILFVSSFDSPNEFFGQLSKLPMEAFEKFQEKLEQYYESAAPDGNVQVNHIVCTKSSSDKLVYRAQVLSVTGDKARLFYTDYGFTEVAHQRDIRRLPLELVDFPQQGIRCVLKDLPPNLSVDSLKSLLLDNVIMVDLCSSVGDKWEVKLTPGAETNKAIMGLLNPSTDFPFQDQYTKAALSSGVIDDVVVTEVIDPNHFWCQLQQNTDQLAELSDELEAYYGALGPEDERIPKPTLGSPCIAKYSVDNFWYRAIITGVTKTGSVEVLFVDYGNSEQQSAHQVKAISPEFFTLPLQAVECELYGVSQQTWQPSDIATFTELVKDNTLTAVFKGYREATGFFQVDLSDSAGNNILTLFEQTMAKSNVKAMEDDVTGWGSPSKQSSSASSAWLDGPQEDSRAYSNTSKTQDGWGEPSPSKKRIDSGKATSKFDHYTTLNIPSGSTKEVVMVHPENPSEFYVQLIEYNEQLVSMSEQLQSENQTASGAGPITSPVVGIPCCAVYAEDEQWYRSSITKVTGSKAQVRFVDYGNHEEVSTAGLRNLNLQFSELPAQAVKCKLAGTNRTAASWTTDEIERFKELVTDHEFTAEFGVKDSNNAYEVTLKSDNNKSINMQFSDSGLTTAPSSGAKEIEFGSSGLTTAPSSSAKEIEFGGSYPEPAISPGDKQEVIVSWVINLGEIYCQLVSSSSQFNAMMLKLQEHFDRSAAVPVTKPEVGMVCTACFAEDNAWYRARVAHSTGNSVTLQYIDYGNCDVVSCQDVKRIPAEFLTLPIQAVKCHLRGIKPIGETWPAISNDIYLTHFQGTMMCTFLSSADGKFLVDLEHNGKSLIEDLTCNKLAQEDDLSSSESESPPSSPAISKTKVTIKPGGFLDIVVIHVESVKKIWCRLTNVTLKMKDMMEAMQSTYSSMNSEDHKLCSPTAGTACVVRLSDQQWHRAIVFSRPSPSKLDIHLIDKGAREIVHPSQCKEILAEFMELPELAFRCRLSNPPRKISEDKEREFAEAVTGKELVAQLERVDREQLVVTLFDISEGEEVNIAETIFREEPTAQPIPTEQPEIDVLMQDYLPPAVPEGSVTGYISVMHTIGSFFIQLESMENELASLAEKIQARYSTLGDSTGFAGTIASGMKCCAQFLEDNVWYRAVVEDVKDESVEVQFVDYGNKETVTRSNIRVLHSEFFEIPLMALQCKLDGVKPAASDTWTMEANDTFSSLTEDKLLVITFKSLAPLPSVHIDVEGCDVGAELVQLGMAVVDEMPQLSEEIIAKEEVPASKVCDITCRVVHVESLEKIYILPSSDQEQYREMYNKLKELASESSSLELCQPGSNCCIQVEDSGQFYRGVVAECDQQTVTVKLLDIGSTHVLPESSVKTLPEEVASDHPFAVECRLPKIGVYSDPQVAVSQLKDMVMDTEVTVTGIRDSERCDVKELKVASKNVLLELQQIVPSQGQNYKPMSVPYNVKSQVCVSHISSINDFWVQLIDIQQDLEHLRDSLFERYSSVGESEKVVDELYVGMPVVAVFETDSCWYRGLVSSVADTTAGVLFVDYGNEEAIPLGEMRSIDSEFLEIRTHAYHCSLHGVQLSDDQSVDVVARFQEVTGEGEKTLLAEFLQLPITDSIHQIKLLDMGLDVATTLIEEGVLLPIQSPVDKVSISDASQLQAVVPEESVGEERTNTSDEDILQIHSNPSAVSTPLIARRSSIDDQIVPGMLSFGLIPGDTIECSDIAKDLTPSFPSSSMWPLSAGTSADESSKDRLESFDAAGPLTDVHNVGFSHFPEDSLQSTNRSQPSEQVRDDEGVSITPSPGMTNFDSELTTQENVAGSGEPDHDYNVLQEICEIENPEEVDLPLDSSEAINTPQVSSSLKLPIESSEISGDDISEGEAINPLPEGAQDTLTSTMASKEENSTPKALDDLSQDEIVQPDFGAISELCEREDEEEEETGSLARAVSDASESGIAQYESSAISEVQNCGEEMTLVVSLDLSEGEAARGDYAAVSNTDDKVANPLASLETELLISNGDDGDASLLLPTAEVTEAENVMHLDTDLCPQETSLSTVATSPLSGSDRTQFDSSGISDTYETNKWQALDSVESATSGSAGETELLLQHDTSPTLQPCQKKEGKIESSDFSVPRCDTTVISETNYDEEVKLLQAAAIDECEIKDVIDTPAKSGTCDIGFEEEIISLMATLDATPLRFCTMTDPETRDSNKEDASAFPPTAVNDLVDFKTSPHHPETCFRKTVQMTDGEIVTETLRCSSNDVGDESQDFDSGSADISVKLVGDLVQEICQRAQEVNSSSQNSQLPCANSIEGSQQSKLCTDSVPEAKKDFTLGLEREITVSASIPPSSKHGQSDVPTTAQSIGTKDESVHSAAETNQASTDAVCDTASHDTVAGLPTSTP